MFTRDLLLSIRAHQLVNRLSLSASPQGGKSEGGESFLKSYSLVSIDLHLPLEKRPRFSLPWNVSNTRNDISARPMSRPNEAWKRHGREVDGNELGRRWISRRCKWLDDVEGRRGWFWKCNAIDDWKEGFIGRMFYARGMMDEWVRMDGSLWDYLMRWNEDVWFWKMKLEKLKMILFVMIII